MPSLSSSTSSESGIPSLSSSSSSVSGMPSLSSSGSSSSGIPSPSRSCVMGRPSSSSGIPSLSSSGSSASGMPSLSSSGSSASGIPSLSSSSSSASDAIFGTFLLHDERSLAIAQETNLWGAHLRWWRPSNSEHHQYVHHHGRHDREGGQDTQPLSIGKRIPNRPLVDEQCKDYRTEQCRQRNYDRYRVNLIVRKALMGHVSLEEGIDASQACK
uniref:Uncharacterized protein n=1 Tax=Anopheles culicifacies TaxID=139723 RepID=A0A182M1W5_9DIPT